MVSGYILGEDVVSRSVAGCHTNVKGVLTCRCVGRCVASHGGRHCTDMEKILGENT